jgi:hypothetical protein
MLPTKFHIIWQNGFRGEDFLEINQSETKIVWGPCLFTDRQVWQKLTLPLPR